MPVILKIESPNDQRLAVWEITEDESTLIQHLELSPNEKEILSAFTNQTRRLQWLAVRSLLKEFHPIRPVIDYEASGKPFLVANEDKVSISHSGKHAAIILNHNKATGIDIEEINPRIKKIGERFTNEIERSCLKMVNDKTLVEYLCIIWAAKEVLFKMHHSGNISFKENFLVEPFSLSGKGLLNTYIILDNTKTHIPLEYMKINNYVLVYPLFNS